jgi:hypothetical protein
MSDTEFSAATSAVNTQLTTLVSGQAITPSFLISIVHNAYDVLDDFTVLSHAQKQKAILSAIDKIVEASTLPDKTVVVIFVNTVLPAVIDVLDDAAAGGLGLETKADTCCCGCVTKSRSTPPCLTCNVISGYKTPTEVVPIPTTKEFKAAVTSIQLQLSAELKGKSITIATVVGALKGAIVSSESCTKFLPAAQKKLAVITAVSNFVKTSSSPNKLAILEFTKTSMPTLIDAIVYASNGYWKTQPHTSYSFLSFGRKTSTTPALCNLVSSKTPTA